MMSQQAARYWNEFRTETGKGEVEPFDVFKIGDSVESANAGAALVLSGRKTATSALPEEFDGSRPPHKGDLSIIADGHDHPVAVVETTEAIIKPFAEASEDFAHAYGEWDGTLGTWRKKNASYYEMVCERLGLEWHEQRELVFERFRLLHRNEVIVGMANG